jgi:hypothetical protein
MNLDRLGNKIRRLFEPEATPYPESKDGNLVVGPHLDRCLGRHDF